MATKQDTKVAEVRMNLTKVTKNTYRFESSEADTPMPTLYVAQSAFDSQPVSITVTVTV